MVVRTSFVCGLVIAAGLVVYWQLSGMWHLRAIAERDRIIAEMTQRLAQKEAMIERLGRNRRMAVIDILDQSLDESGQPLETSVRFVEVDDAGRELGRQEFTLPGGVLFVDTWTAKFPHEDVAQGHPFRGSTLVLLRRIYSEQMPPRDGFPIDTPGAVPDGYAIGEVAEFEKRLWAQFWEVATDAAAAQRFGVRVAQGEVVYKPVNAGQRFELSIDASGGLNLLPIAAETTISRMMDR